MLADRDIYSTMKIDEDLDDKYTLRSLELLLDVLDKHDTQATFFMLGEVGERKPYILKKIHERGHELAFHGWTHKRLDVLDPTSFKDELKKTMKVYRDAVAVTPMGFRAPQFSLNKQTRWVLDVLIENGFQYDSSIYPCNISYYGKNEGPVVPYYPCLENPVLIGDQRKIIEFPALVFPILKRKLPMAGGFWLRMFGSKVVSKAITRMNESGNPATIYLHNWEMSNSGVRAKHRILNYRNIGIPITKKLEHLLRSHEFTSISSYMATF